MLGQEYSRLIIFEVGRVAALTALVAVLFLVGIKAETLSGATKWVIDKVMLGEVDTIQIDWDPAPSTNPWLLAESDLDYQRVLMNWMGKPGFMWLGVYAMGLIVGVGVVLVNLRLMAVSMVSIARRVRKMRFEVGQLRVAISGTVRISARSGVIYLSGLPKAMADGLEEYGFMVREAQVVVISTVS